MKFEIFEQGLKTLKMPKRENRDTNILLEHAWQARENAIVFGPTRVGVALRGTNGKIYSGFNIEHPFRSGDVHAEKAAIILMIEDGCRFLEEIVIVADREKFTPCGSCLDWLIQYADRNCLISFQREPNGSILTFSLADLMPHFPF